MKICASMTAAQTYVHKNFKVLVTPAGHTLHNDVKDEPSDGSAVADSAQSAQSSPRFVEMGTTRPGIYESQPAAESYIVDDGAA